MARSLLASIFGMRCPSCREGKLFSNSNPYRLKGIAEMHNRCPNCGQVYEPEPGFFYGSMYVSYGITVAIYVAIVVLMTIFGNPGIWEIVISLSVVLIIVAPMVFRLSRSVWAHMFIKRKKESKKND
ncbi:MAG: DUF983 domain-containing protein [Cryomorphaceae bacterium]|nr:DUF983 domain-containing protein [Cryomorphaceae bacterium]